MNISGNISFINKNLGLINYPRFLFQYGAREGTRNPTDEPPPAKYKDYNEMLMKKYKPPSKSIFR